MPLSKARDRERKGLLKFQPNSNLNNPHLLAHMKVYPQGFNADGSYKRDYNPALDLYINPLARQAQFQPKHPLGYLYPDGRVRLPNMSLVQPNQCEEVKIWIRQPVRG